LNATVVVPTRNRPKELSRCLEALLRQRTERAYEVIVVDDGSASPLTSQATAGVTVIRGEGNGPAAARNAGIARARGAFVLFIDDDAIPEPSWVDAACDFLERHPAHVGVGGRTVSPPFDYLYEHSVECDCPAFWTCNVAYRREVLERLGGFYEGFRAAHCEDLDLGYRALELGSVGFAPDMRVVHPPRRLTLPRYIKRGRLAAAEALLYSRHRDRYPVPRWLPRGTLPIAGVLVHWMRASRAEGLTLLQSPRRLARFLTVSVGQSVIAVGSVLGSSLSRKGSA
jgi:GT2 family glycosyltransferase